MNQLQLDLQPVLPFQNEPIRLLSWWQPFASLMLYGKVETREWATPYRGLVLICSTQKPLYKQTLDKTRHIHFGPEHSQEIDHLKITERLNHPMDDTFLLNGYAIAIGRLVDCREVKMNDKTFFLHPPGMFAHVYEDVKRIRPFTVKGSQKWGTVRAEIRAKIEVLNP